MKNYYTTEKYLKIFLPQQLKKDDVLLKDLTYEFITGFEFYIRSTPIKDSDTCTNNGTMKHLERLKKMVAWAVKNEWLDKKSIYEQPSVNIIAEELALTTNS